MLLKQNPIINELAIYDIAPVTPGVVADLSHMDTNSNVTSHVGLDNLKVCICLYYIHLQNIFMLCFTTMHTLIGCVHMFKTYDFLNILNNKTIFIYYLCLLHNKLGMYEITLCVLINKNQKNTWNMYSFNY